MSELGLVGLLIAELALLFLLSRFLTSALARFFHTVTRSRTLTVYILAMLFLPGTILHELAHLFGAAMLFVPVGKIEILPAVEGDEVRLGSAEIAQTDILRRTIIGMAPIIVGLSVVIGTLWLAQGTFTESTPLWQIVVLLYVIFEVSNTMFSSKKDMEGAVAFLVGTVAVLVTILAVSYSTGYLPSLDQMVNLRSPALRGFLEKADLFLAVPLGVDIVFLGLAKILGLKST